MTVQLRYSSQPNGNGPKDTAEAILRSRADSRDFTFFMDSELTQHYEYKLIVDYQDHFGIGAHDTRLESEWISTEARSLAVHPSWLGRVLPVAIQLAPNIPEDVSEVHARVRYANAARNIDDTTLVRLNPQNRSQLVHIRLVDANEQFEVAQTLFYKDGTREDLPLLRLPDPTAGSADEAIVISAPRANRLDADVIMSDPLGELKSVLVDTQTLQNGSILDSRTLELTGAGQRQVWSVRLPQRGAPATLRFKERHIYKDGGLDSDDWREASSPNLVAGIPAGGILPVTMKYIGPNPSEFNLNALLVELEFKDPSGDPKYDQKETLLIDDSPSSRVQDWIIRRRDRNVQPEYRWRLTLLQADGGERSTEFRTDTHQTLFVRVPQL